MVVYLDKEKRFVIAGVLWSNAVTTCATMVPQRPDETLEEMYARIGNRTLDMSLDYSPNEAGATERCVRGAMNACLLLSSLGCRRVGYANPDRAAALEKYLKKKTHHAEANRQELRTMPVVFGFEQGVRLYEREGLEHGGHGDATGRIVAPHWRRGHFRMQRHGHGLTEVKRVFIRPVMVRADLFSGSSSATATVYKT